MNSANNNILKIVSHNVGSLRCSQLTTIETVLLSPQHFIPAKAMHLLNSAVELHTAWTSMAKIIITFSSRHCCLSDNHEELKPDALSKIASVLQSDEPILSFANRNKRTN